MFGYSHDELSKIHIHSHFVLRFQIAYRSSNILKICNSVALAICRKGHMLGSKNY